jgi:hypothetical protein
MSKSTIIFVLGADRVGKSTFIKNLRYKIMDSSSGIASLFHFDGPKPNHNSPIDQYLDPLRNYLTVLSADTPDYDRYALCDRGGAEVCFYEKFRRHTPINQSWAQSFESWVESNFDDYHTVLIHQDWAIVKNRHLDEIIEAYPHSTKFWQHSRLEERHAEHSAYYDYMYHYLEDYSLCPSVSYLCGNESEDLDDFYSNVVKGTEEFIDQRF